MAKAIASNYALINGELVPITTDACVQVNSAEDLQNSNMQKLPPTSWAYTPGWKNAWQKKNDGTWEQVIST